MEPTDTPFRNGENAVRRIDDVVFVMNPDTSELHSFKGIGGRIWELSDGSHTVQAITGVIVDEYEVERETAERDVLEFLQELQAKDLIRLEPSA